MVFYFPFIRGTPAVFSLPENNKELENLRQKKKKKSRQYFEIVYPYLYVVWLVNRI